MRKIDFKSYWDQKPVGMMHPVFHAAFAGVVIRIMGVPLIGLTLTAAPYAIRLALLGFRIKLSDGNILFKYKMFNVAEHIEDAECRICSEPASLSWRAVLESNLDLKAYHLDFCSQEYRDKWKEEYYHSDSKIQQTIARSMLSDTE